MKSTHRDSPTKEPSLYILLLITILVMLVTTISRAEESLEHLDLIISPESRSSLSQPERTKATAVMIPMLFSSLLRQVDSDGDGLSDTYEINQAKTDPNQIDTDKDGLTDDYEINKAKTDPNQIDTDKDGRLDGIEISLKTDPLNPGDGISSLTGMIFRPITLISKNNNTSTISISDVVQVSVDNVSINEGDSGITEMVFKVSLDKEPLVPVSVEYTTFNGTAAASSDYTPIFSSVLNFKTTDTSLNVIVRILGDVIFEADETMILTLSNPSEGLNILKGNGIGTIINDDKLSSCKSFKTTITEIDLKSNKLQILLPGENFEGDEVCFE